MESRSRVDSLLRVITALDFEIDLYARLVGGRLRADPGYRAIQQIPGVGPILAAVFVAESATSPASVEPSSWPPGPG